MGGYRVCKCGMSKPLSEEQCYECAAQASRRASDDELLALVGQDYVESAVKLARNVLDAQRALEGEKEELRGLLKSTTESAPQRERAYWLAMLLASREIV